MYRLRLLGGVDLEPHDAGAAGILTQPRRLGLLVHLALQPAGAWLRRDRLLPVFWPELDEPRGRAALSQSLHVLRRALGAGLVQSRGAEELRLDPGGLDLDVHRFEEACARADWGPALECYRGELLPGFHLGEAPEFERWVDGWRDRLHRRALEAAAALAAATETRGDLATSIAARRRALELDPHDETSLRALARLLKQGGNRAEAIRTGDAFVARLRDELDLEPSPDTAHFLATLRQADVAPPTALVAAPAPAEAPAPPASPDASAAPPRRRIRYLTAALLVLLALGAAAVRALGTRPEPTGVKVTVLPFAVRGAPDLDYLREGMVDLLATKLDALGTVQAVPTEAVLAHIEDELGTRPHGLTPEDAGRIARAFDSDLFIVGHVVRVGRAIELSALLYDAEGGRAGVATRRADDDAALPAAVDALVRDLVAARLAAPADRLRRLAAVSTTSHEALRHYLEGERRYRHGDYGDALEAFRLAVAADTLFALAYYRVSVMAGWVAAGEYYLPAARRAAELGDRLSDRDRTLVRAHLAYAEGDYDAAERGFLTIVGRWPDDAEAWYDLGEVLFHGNPRRGRPIAEARDPFLRAERLVGPSAEAMSHRVMLRLVEGDDEGLAPMFDSLLGLYPPGASRHFIARVLQLAVTGDTPALRSELDRLPTRAPADIAVAAWAVACYTARLGLADTLAQALLSDRTPRDVRVAARAFLAQVALARGRWEPAARELERLAALDRPEATRLAARFAAIAPLVGIAGGDSTVALRLLDRLARPAGGIAVDSTAHAGLARYRRADSLFQAGRLEESRGWYESFPIIFQDDLPLMAPAQLRLGAVYEAAARPEAARRAYRRVLELWQDGDPRLEPARARARARLAALEPR